MVLVFGSAATPSGAPPTRTVAVTEMQPLAGWAVPPPEDADAAMTVPIDARLVMATIIRQTARQFGLMMSCLLDRQWRVRPMANRLARMPFQYAWERRLSRTPTSGSERSVAALGGASRRGGTLHHDDAPGETGAVKTSGACHGPSEADLSRIKWSQASGHLTAEEAMHCGIEPFLDQAGAGDAAGPAHGRLQGRRARA